MQEVCFKKLKDENWKAEITKDAKEAHLAKLVDEAVSKAVSKAVGPLWAEIANLKQNDAEQSKQLTYLTGIVCATTEALLPAIRMALYESSVYGFVESIIPNNEHLGLIRHQMVRLCNHVIVALRADLTDEKMELKAVPNTVGDDRTKIRVVLAALVGCKTFIAEASEEDVKHWTCEGRNQIMHGGEFLKCLLASSSTDDKASTETYEAGRVINLEEKFKEAVTSRKYVNEELGSIQSAVMEVREQLIAKGVEVISEKHATKFAKKVTNAIIQSEKSSGSQNNTGSSSTAAKTAATKSKHGEGNKQRRNR